MTQVSPLLGLPTDIFHLILEILPAYSRVSLILTCSQLCAVYLQHALPDINQQTTISRLQKLYLLRLLRRDLSDSKLFLCHNCLKFHPNTISERDADDAGRGETLTMPVYSGFPYCNSGFTRALHDVESRHTNPQDRKVQLYYGTYRVPEFSMAYIIGIDIGRRGQCTWSQHIYRGPNLIGNEDNYAILQPSEFAAVARSTNVDFCEHLWLGDDYVPGDGSTSDQVESVYAELAQHFTDATGRPLHKAARTWPKFSCSECSIQVTIQAWSLSRVRLFSLQTYQAPQAARRWRMLRELLGVDQRLSWWKNRKLQRLSKA